MVRECELAPDGKEECFETTSAKPLSRIQPISATVISTEAPQES
jgi:hypothetical protein